MFQLKYDGLSASQLQGWVFDPRQVDESP